MNDMATDRQPRNAAAWLTQRFDAILFDFNGTLADDESLIPALLNELLQWHGYPAVSQQRYDTELIGRSDREIFEQILGRGHPNVDPWVAELTQRYQETTDQVDPIAPSTIELIRILKAAGFHLGVVTGAGRDPVIRALNRSMITELFDVIVTLDDTLLGKPHPEGYLRALRSLNVDLPSRVLVFEDSDVGVAAAHAAGMRCVRVRHSAYHDGAVDGPLSGLGPETVEQVRTILSRRGDP